MIDWSKYKAEEVKNGNDENGNRLFSLFVQDYIKIFKTDVCPNCNDFPVKFQNFINKVKEMENKNPCEFQLKKKYEGIPTSFGSQVYVTNENVSDELAIELLKNHPLGKELFETLPSNIDEVVAGSKSNTTSDKATTVNVFEKQLSIEEVKELFEKIGFKSNATSVNGLQKAIDEKLNEEQKEKIKGLLA